MDSVIFHIDVNSAFLSWTAIRLLAEGSSVDIRTIPAAVGGDISKRRGVILAKSIPAKAFRVTTGEPITDALKKCPNLHIVQPDHGYYQKCSEEMLSLLSEYSPDIHPYSIDECFMTYVPFPGDGGSPVSAANHIRQHIQNALGFTVNIGISTNKLLAKMASDFTKPNRVHTLFPEEIPQKMWPLPVRDLFMVGRSSAHTLELLGIKTIGDLAHTDPAILTSHLKSHGQTIWEYANGLEHTPIDTKRHIAKGIGNSTTLASDITESFAARKVLLSLSESVSRRLRSSGQCAGMVSVEIKYNDFRTASHQMQILTPSQNTDIIYRHACQLFDELWEGTPIRLLGIRTSKLTDQSNLQMNLFDTVENKKLQNLDKALDAIRSKYGRDAVVRGSFLKSKEDTPK
ncbi:MAG: DNA polymerase IV [Lachnospiraceae bacterium]|nr:DNA polymerase IV [Lachnospiraceae bacterium]